MNNQKPSGDELETLIECSECRRGYPMPQMGQCTECGDWYCQHCDRVVYSDSEYPCANCWRKGEKKHRQTYRHEAELGLEGGHDDNR